MTELFSPSAIDPAPLQIFVRRVRTFLERDLRTSLGTIVNYASVIEEGSGHDDEGLRDLPRRIRVQATRSAEMLQLVLEAMFLAGSARAYATVDPGALLASVLAEINGEAGIRQEAVPLPRPPGMVEVEPEIVAFVWRTFLLLENDAAARPLSSARTTVEFREDVVRIGLTFDSNPRGSATTVDFDAFAGMGDVETPTIHAFALQLSRDLIAARGGELDLYGRVGSDAAVFLDLPASL